MLDRIRIWAKAIKRDVAALAGAFFDPDVGVLAKIVIAMVVAYAASPIDLIPDFIPIVGYLDDLLILPLGIALAIRLIGPAKMASLRLAHDSVPVSFGRWGAILVVAIWFTMLVICLRAFA